MTNDPPPPSETDGPTWSLLMEVLVEPTPTSPSKKKKKKAPIMDPGGKRDCVTSPLSHAPACSWKNRPEDHSGD